MDDLGFQEQDSKAGPAFNMAISYLNRINFLFTEANTYSRMGERGIAEWYKTLSAIYREIHPVLKKDEEGICESLLESIEKESIEFQRIMNRIRKDHSKPLTIQTNIEKYLHKLHLSLIDYAYNNKLLMPQSDDPRYAAYG